MRIFEIDQQYGKTPHGYYHASYFGRPAYYDLLPGYKKFQDHYRNKIGSWEDIIHYMRFIIRDYRKPDELTGTEIANVLCKEGGTNPDEELIKFISQQKLDSNDFSSWDDVFSAMMMHHQKEFYRQLGR